MLKILEEIPLANYFKTSVILNLSVIAVSLLLIGRLPPQIPIFYGLPQSEAQISSSISIIIPPILSLLFILLNFVLIKTVRGEFIKTILVIAGLATAVFASVAALKIILLVGNI